jgi:hypothetical protein
VLRADVSKIEESKQFVDEVVNHFGRCKSIICFRFSMAFCANILECIYMFISLCCGWWDLFKSGSFGEQRWNNKSRLFRRFHPIQ